MKGKKIYWVLLILILAAAAVTSVIVLRSKKLPDSRTLGYLAYDKNKEEGYTVYIKENS